MILAEKIVALRKQNNWSQEELASRLGVSRQAVSKWESCASIPDLDKILKLSEIFAVSTDYLLKDEMEAFDTAPAVQTEEQPDSCRTVTFEEAETYLGRVSALRNRYAAGVSVFILSPAPLLLLGGWTDGTAREDFAAGTGLVLLLALISAGLALLLPASLQLSPYEYLEKEPFNLAWGVRGVLESRRAEGEAAYRRMMTIGVLLCVLAAVPLFGSIALGGSDFAVILCLCAVLVIVSVAVFIIVRTCLVSGAFDRLLECGDYSRSEKAVERRIGWFSGAYWCAATAVYLAVSMPNNTWRTSWVVWPVAAMLYAALNLTLRAWVRRKDYSNSTF